MIVKDYRALTVRVMDLGNGVYRVCDMALVDVFERSGARLLGGADDLIGDLMACAVDSGLIDCACWCDAYAVALDDGSTLVSVAIKR